MGQKPSGWVEENFGPGSEKIVASGDVSLLGREKKLKHKQSPAMSANGD
jgi:hypothetical protein